MNFDLILFCTLFTLLHLYVFYICLSTHNIFSSVSCSYVSRHIYSVHSIINHPLIAQLSIISWIALRVLSHIRTCLREANNTKITSLSYYICPYHSPSFHTVSGSPTMIEPFLTTPPMLFSLIFLATGSSNGLLSCNGTNPFWANWINISFIRFLSW
jgi:hypothetical protein